MTYLDDDRPATQHKVRLIVWLAAAFGLSLVVIYFIFSRDPSEQEAIVLPNFSEIADIEERKSAFFGFLLPFIEDSNRQTLKLRKEVMKLQRIHAKSSQISEQTVQRIREIQLEYKLDETKDIADYSFDELLSRIDVIPPSMALAQAALESAWGTSRFAREGNNLYGLWCYKPGCGMVPKKRDPGKKHEVQSFKTPKECFDRYIHNLNTNPHYGSMRAIRRAIRRKEGDLVGVDLMEGLERYSEESFTYIEKVQRVIRSNDLERHDT